jgi:GDPmannose 4,6-dehydratase
MKKALVFGGSGQAGSYLVELLESKGYEVSAPSRNAINFEKDDFWWKLDERIRWFKPDEVYNFAAKMFAENSWKYPIDYMEVNGIAVLSILQSIQKWHPKAKFFNAGSADVFDKWTTHYDEKSPRKISTPYGLSKQVAEDAVRIYREQGLFACTGIFFNMESPRRADYFFSKKVVREAVRIKKEFGKQEIEKMKLGRISARRDWGWAPEYVEVAWKMLQQDTPADYVIGTGENHSCKEFIIEALLAAGLYIDIEDIDEVVEYDKTPIEEPDSMWANPSKVENYLGWKAKYKFKDVIRMLVEAELEVTKHN